MLSERTVDEPRRWKDKMKRIGTILLALAFVGCGRPVHHAEDIAVESVLCTSEHVASYFTNPSAGLPKATQFSEVSGKQQFILTRLRHGRNQRFGGELRLILKDTGLSQSIKLHGVSFGNWDSYVTPFGEMTWGNDTGTPVIVHEWLELEWK